MVLDEKSWTIEGNTLTAKAEKEAQSISGDFIIESNECDLIKLSVIGITAEMKRK